MIVKEKQFDYNVGKELKSINLKYTPSERPTATLTIGQPGSGKTHLGFHKMEELSDNAVFINGDNYRRYHPDYELLKKNNDYDRLINKTSSFSGQFVENMIDACSLKKYNLIIEGTGRTFDVPYKTASLLKQRGYSINLSVMAVKPVYSKITALMRSYDMAKDGTLPRKTMFSTHDRIIEKLPLNLDRLNETGLFDTVEILTRDFKDILKEGNRLLTPGIILKRYWDEPLSSEEKADILKDIALLRKLESEFHLNQSDLINSIENEITVETEKNYSIDMDR